MENSPASVRRRERCLQPIDPADCGEEPSASRAWARYSVLLALIQSNGAPGAMVRESPPSRYKRRGISSLTIRK